jgi:hypothetical protein
LTLAAQMKIGGKKMLRDGYFIKEEPPKIGAHYIPQFYARPSTPEERFVQDIMLGHRPEHESPVVKLFGRLLGV